MNKYKDCVYIIIIPIYFMVNDKIKGYYTV